jgi:hypothetical protein
MDTLLFDTPADYWHETNWARYTDRRTYFEPAHAPKPVLLVLRNGLTLADVLNGPVEVTIDEEPLTLSANPLAATRKKVSVFGVVPNAKCIPLSQWLAGLADLDPEDLDRRTKQCRRWRNL